MEGMRSWDVLPDHTLAAAGEVTSQFIALGITAFRSAARLLYQVPYGRKSDRADFRLVLPEHCGTCSTKHALLAALAAEQELPVHLTLGIYEMTDWNTPGVGAVLEKYEMAFVPEAHCYLTYDGIRIDVTREVASAKESITRFLHEERITPSQIGAYKVAMHQAWMREWVARTMPNRDWQSIWQIREDCIAALSGPEKL